MLALTFLATLATTSPKPASAAEVVAAFNGVTLVANPRPWPISGLANTIDGSTAGGNFARIFTNRSPATGVVVEYTFTTPKNQVTRVQLYNNGGSFLDDADGIGTALMEVFDASGTVIFSGTLTGGNGAAPFDTVFPTALDNVARVRLSNITKQTVGFVAVDILWREFRAYQNVATPSITTAINSDGFSDNVTVTGTDGLAGTLTWTLYGPVAPGANGTCSSATWAGAPVFATGTVRVPGNGVVVTTPPSAPTGSGCYSYGDVLSGPYYTANAVSVVGLPAETFAVSATPTVTTVINADGYSDDVTISGTDGFAGSLAWTLLGPVDAGPSGTCRDADYSGAPTSASGTVSVVGDATVTTTPPTDPTAPGCYTYEDRLTGPNITGAVISVRGQPAESFARDSTPSIQTVIAQDGTSDDVTVTGTSGFSGTLTWTLYGPASVGPDGTCADADFSGAPVFATATLAVPGDGSYTTSPTAPPSADGCYSYGDVLAGPNYTADAVSAVGQPSETFSIPPAPTPTSTTSTSTNSTTPASTDPSIVPPTTVDPCATTMSTTTTTTSPASTTTSSTTTTTSSSPTTTTSTTTTTSSPPIEPEAVIGPIGFRRAPAHVTEPCESTTTVQATVVAPTNAAVPSGGAASSGGGSRGGALPVTGQRPIGQITLAAMLLVLIGAVVVVAVRPWQ